MFTVQVMSSLKVEMAFKDKVELKEKIEPKWQCKHHQSHHVDILLLESNF